MTQIFTAFIIASVTGTTLALILTLFSPVTRKIFSPHWHYYIWLAVLLVMMLPLKLDLQSEEFPKTNISETITESVGNDSEPYKPHSSSEEAKDSFQNYTPQEIPTNDVSQHSLIQRVKATITLTAPLLCFLWLTVAVLLFTVKAVSYIAFLIKVRKTSRPISCPELKEFTSRRVRVRKSAKAHSPLLFGVIFPTLLLPDTDISSTELHYVLAHETTHLKRNDILFKWLVLAVKCIHWFNPAIYFIANRINVDCEISCDSAVVKGLNDTSKKEYAETVLSLITKNSCKTYPLTTGMTGNKKTLERRFTMLKSKLKISKRTAIISAILAVLVLAVTLTASGMLTGFFTVRADNSELNVITDKLPDRDTNTDEVTNPAFNVLLVGVDEKSFFDTIMLFKVENGGIKGVGVPLLPLNNDFRYLPFNYGSDADQILIDTIKSGLDVPVHYYVKMDLSAAEKIIDSVGGINFDVPMDMFYDDPWQDLHIELNKGTQHLNGEEACALLRYRAGYPDSMVGRTNLHMAFVKEFLDQKLTVENIAKAPEIFVTVSDSVKTNYPIGNLEQDLKIIAAIGSNNYTFEMLPLTTELPIVVK